MQRVRMETFVWSMVASHLRGEWKCVTTVTGGPSATMGGLPGMHVLSAQKWDTRGTVRIHARIKLLVLVCLCVQPYYCISCSKYTLPLSPHFLILSLSPLLALSPSLHHSPPSLPPSLHLPSLPPSLSSSLFSGSLAVGYADFGRGTGLILLSNVRCQGSEDNLSQCPHGGVNQHRCNHEEDVGVICVGECTVDQCPFSIQCTDTVDKFKSCKCYSFHIN